MWPKPLLSACCCHSCPDHWWKGNYLSPFSLARMDPQKRSCLDVHWSGVRSGKFAFTVSFSHEDCVSQIKYAHFLCFPFPWSYNYPTELFDGCMFGVISNSNAIQSYDPNQLSWKRWAPNCCIVSIIREYFSKNRFHCWIFLTRS